MDKKRILVLDDSEVTLKMLIKALRDANYDARGTPNLTTFGRLLQEFDPDMILMDLAMPAMDGDQVCIELRSQFKDRHIPVVMMSGLAEGELDQKARQAGADAYISKKAGFKVFVEEVTRIFSHHPSRWVVNLPQRTG